MSDSPTTHILVPVDFSACSLEAARYAVDLAEVLRGTVKILHVLRPPPPYVGLEVFVTATSFNQGEALQEYTTRRANEAMTAFMRNLNASQGNLPQVQVVIGHPVSAIIEAARHDVDLIVMGTHGHTGFLHALVGSVTAKIVRLADCPVMTLRTPDEVATHGHPLRVASTV